MGSKPDRYVIHIRDSKSSRKECGQPPYCAGSSPFGDSFRSDWSKLVFIQLSSSAAPVRSECGADEVILGAFGVSDAEGFGDGDGDGLRCLGSYCRPRHHIGASESFEGRGS